MNIKEKAEQKVPLYLPNTNIALWPFPNWVLKVSKLLHADGKEDVAEKNDKKVE